MKFKTKWLLFAVLLAGPHQAEAEITCGADCLVPPDWDQAWDAGANGYATTYVRDLAEEMSNILYPPISNWNNVVQGYLSPAYSNYSTPYDGYTPPMYRRHVGWDNGRPDNTAVFTITTGQVTFLQYVPDVGYNNVVIIREKKNGVFQDRWWTYGHVQPSAGIEVGTDVVEGQQIATIDEYDGFPHVHLSVHATNWQADIVDPTPPTEWGQHWGIARGITQELAESTATDHTLHPIHAYALYKDYDVTVGNDTTPPAAPGSLEAK